MSDDTSTHVRRAVGGDRESLEWVVARVTPLLLAQARHRLGARLAVHHAPDDLVQEVWAIALPKLGDLANREVFGTQELLAFLGRILLFRVNNLVSKHITGKPGREAAASGGTSPVGRLPAEQSGVITRAVLAERTGAVHDALEQLPERDRALIVMRGLERHAVKEIAVVLGMTENAVSVAYRRALEKLRSALPGSVFDEFAED